MVSDTSPFPFLLRIFQLLISTMSILMASKVDEIWMSHCCVPNSVSKTTSSFWNLTDLQSFRENIHAEYISWPLGVPFMTDYAFRTTFFNILLLFYDMLYELICIFLRLHLSHYLFPLLLSQSLLLISLFVNLLSQVLTYLRIIHILLVCQRPYNNILPQNNKTSILIFLLGQLIKLIKQGSMCVV